GPSGVRPPLADSLHEVTPAARLAPWQVQELRAELQTAAPALAEARQLAGLPEGRFTIAWTADVVSTNLGDLDGVRPVINLLRLDAALRAQEKDGDGALASCRAALNASRSLGDTPPLIAQLVRLAGRAS